MKLLRALFIALGLLGLASSAWAQDTKLVVLPFTGERAEPIQAKVKQVLREVGQSLASEAETPSQDDMRRLTPKDLNSKLTKLSAKRNIQAFILGDITSSAQGWRLDLEIRSGHDGSPVSHTTIEAPRYTGLLTNVREHLVDLLAVPLLQSSPPEGDVEEVELEPAPSGDRPKGAAEIDETQVGDVPSEDSEKSSKQRRPYPLMLGIKGGYVFRTLDVAETQNPFNEFQGQRGAFPTINFEAGVYPVAFFTGGFFANVGVIGEIEQSLGGSATVEDTDTQVNTGLFSYQVGPRVRFAALKDRGEIAFSATFGKHRMSLDFDPAAPGQAPPRSVTGTGVGGVPDVDYQFLRFGVDGSYRFGRSIGLNLCLGYRLVNNPGDGPGEIKGDFNAAGEPAFFPSDEADGFDAASSIDIRLAKGLDLRLGADLRYYFHDFNVTPDQQVVDGRQRRPTAGGAVDAYVRGTAGVVWTPRL